MAAGPSSGTSSHEASSAGSVGIGTGPTSVVEVVDAVAGRGDDVVDAGDTGYLPGEQVEVREGAVYVDGSRIDEPWTTRPASYSKPPMRLGPREYYVLGDNRANSSDSHIWGAQPEDLIMGKVWITIWPPSSWPLIGRLMPRATSGA